MPTLRTYTGSSTVQKSKFSNFGNSKFSTQTKNTEFFARSAKATALNAKKTARATVKTAKNSASAARTNTAKFAKSAQDNIFAFRNAYSAQKKQNRPRPTMRGAMPTATRWSLSDEGTQNARVNYNRGLSMSAGAAAARAHAEFVSASASAPASRISALSSSRTQSATSYFMGARANKAQSKPLASGFGFANARANTMASSTAFEGSAAKKLEPELDGNAARSMSAAPKTQPQYTRPGKSPAQKKQKKKHPESKPIVTAIPGQMKSPSILHSAKFSPMFLSVAKVTSAVIVFVAIMSFVRVGFNAATVTAGISSKSMSSAIEQEINTKNQLQVQDSALANSSRIRNAAQDYQLGAPVSTEVINLKPDVLSVNDNGEIKLVDSLNKLSGLNS